MGGIKKAVGGVLGGGDDAADAAKDASRAQVAAQKEALDYLKEKEKLPRQFSEGALRGLGGMYGLKGGEAGFRDKLLGFAQDSPLYAAQQDLINQRLMDAENLQGRQASVGGFLRSGVLADALAKERGRAGVAESQALANIYGQELAGLQGLANLPQNTNAIANQMSQIGQTRAQGIIGAQQSQQAADQAGFGNLMGIASLAAAPFTGGASLAFCDVRLKDNVKYMESVNGHRWYKWDWNDNAKELGLSGSGEGVMAHEVAEYMPEAIGESKGYLTVNYGVLGIQ